MRGLKKTAEKTRFERRHVKMDKNFDFEDIIDNLSEISAKYDPRFPVLPSDEDVSAYRTIKDTLFSDSDFERFSMIKDKYGNVQSYFSDTEKKWVLYYYTSEEKTETYGVFTDDELDRVHYIKESYDVLRDTRDTLRVQIAGVARYVVELFLRRSMDFYKEKSQRRDLYSLMKKIVDLYKKCDFSYVVEEVDYIYGVLTTYQYVYGHAFYEEGKEMEVKTAPDLKDLRRRRQPR